MYPWFIPLPKVHLKIDQRVQRNNFPGIHLNVSWKSYSFELFDQSFDLKMHSYLKTLYIYAQA